MRLEKTAWESRFTHAPLGILAQMIDPGSGDLSRQNVLDVFANRLRQRTMLALRRQAIVAGATAALILVAFVTRHVTSRACRATGDVTAIPCTPETTRDGLCAN